jgi:hypothetical protein
LVPVPANQQKEYMKFFASRKDSYRSTLALCNPLAEGYWGGRRRPREITGVHNPFKASTTEVKATTFQRQLHTVTLKDHRAWEADAQKCHHLGRNRRRAGGEQPHASAELRLNLGEDKSVPQRSRRPTGEVAATDGAALGLVRRAEDCTRDWIRSVYLLHDLMHAHVSEKASPAVEKSTSDTRHHWRS